MIRIDETIQGGPVATLERGELRARVAGRGAALLELWLPGADGLRDVVVGYAEPAGYLRDRAHMNVVVGRVAGRIRGATLELDGTRYPLEANAGAHHLHGGSTGFHTSPFDMRARGETLVLGHHSPAGVGGYPGNVEVEVRYTLSDAALEIVLEARTDALTPINLTHHGYFNLAGSTSPCVLDHELQVQASHVAVSDAELLPTGDLASVRGTHLDFTQCRSLRAAVEAERGTACGGLDHSFALDDTTGAVRPVALLFEPKSGRTLELATEAPCLQVYTANSLDEAGGKAGALVPHSAICLEAQGFPDAVHHASFPSILLAPGETFRNTIRLGFGRR
jgi:aldose 1-epimerase